MDFSKALEQIKEGKKVARSGWNGKNMYIELHKKPYQIQEGEDKLSTSQLFIHMKTASETFVPWVASQTDLLVEDWEIVK